MTVSREIRQRAITLLEQLPGESLIKAVEFLEILSHHSLQLSEVSKTPNSEAGLLRIIQRRLSAQEQNRLSYLRQQSWLNIAENELSAMTRQCLDRRIPDIETLEQETTAWYIQRNHSQKSVDWQFTTADARIRLKRLYPQIEI